MIDKFGLIDPSTSTVLVGMTLGGTWGFVLDNMLGTDEGFREYLWSPERGMAYAMGCLYSHRFGRYVVTILFDMFFTVRRFFVFTFFATACLHGLSAPAPFTSSSLRLCALPSSSHLCLTPSLHTFSAPPLPAHTFSAHSHPSGHPLQAPLLQARQCRRLHSQRPRVDRKRLRLRLHLTSHLRGLRQHDALPVGLPLRPGAGAQPVDLGVRSPNGLAQPR